jgi:hypothetical protein
MANTTGVYGLKPLRHISGAPWNGQVVKCYVSPSYGTALYIGDPVLFSPTLAEKDPTAKMPTINKSAGTAGAVVRGVIVGFEPNPDNLNRLYIPATTGGIAYVCMDPDVVYEIKGNGGAALTSVLVGQNAVMIAKTAGSTATGLSGMALDEGTTTAPTTTQNFTLHILGIQDVEGNELAASATYEVLLNTCENATGRFLGITAS